MTITANNANNKIENVYRAARLGFFQKKTVFPGQQKNWKKPSCFQFLPEKIGRNWKKRRLYFKSGSNNEIMLETGFASFLEDLFPEFFYVKDGRLQFM